MFWVYILKRADNKYYIGQTNNLEARLIRHKAGYCKSTKPYLPVKLVRYEAYKTRSEALVREKYLKNLKSHSAISEILSNMASSSNG